MTFNFFRRTELVFLKKPKIADYLLSSTLFEGIPNSMQRSNPITCLSTFLPLS